MFIDCTLDELKVPGFSGVNPPFGTKKPDGDPVTAREADVNIRMPFSRQRPYHVGETSVTGEVEAHSAFVLETAGITLTLGNGGFTGCRVRVINASAGASTVVFGAALEETVALEAGERLDLVWQGGAWNLESGADTKGVNVPVVSAEPLPAATRAKLYIYNDRLRVAAYSEGEVVRKTLVLLKTIPAHNEAIDLAAALGYPNPSVADTREVFEAVSDLVRSGSADNFVVGDWIDPPFLNVPAGYETGGEITLTRDMVVDGIPMTRLIIVGKNFMVGKNGNTRANVAFQSYHCLGYSGVTGTDGHYMEKTNINTNGYLGCQMRLYLINNMKNALISAGVPVDSDIIYGPARRVSKGGASPAGYDTIEDKVFLPTEYEMFGTHTYSDTTQEAAEYQGRLEYYDSNTKRVKKTKDGTARVYWLASPYSGSAAYFCVVYSSGAANNLTASNVYGVAPAICVA
jgi:hypothetical protein